MTAGDQWDLVRFRLQQIDETLAEARLLLESGLFRGSVNRAYYAMFYAVQALMGARGLTSSKHRGAISVFDQQFIKTGDFPADFSKWLHGAFDMRMGGDYGDMYQVSKEKAQDTLERAALFTRKIKERVLDDPHLKS